MANYIKWLGKCHIQEELLPIEEPFYVEIAGVKWATKNIGANNITDVGLYFQWGDTQGYTLEQFQNNEKYFGWADYKYGNGEEYQTESDMTKYNSEDEKTELDLTDDAAYVISNGEWRMPTNDELWDLMEAVDLEWVTNYNNSGVDGALLIDKLDSSKTLFIPKSQYLVNGNIYLDEDNCNLWGSTVSTTKSNASEMLINSSHIDVYPNARADGFPIRPVLVEV